jgi:hypothetical protein
MDVKNKEILELLTNAKGSMNTMKEAISEKEKIRDSIDLIRKELKNGYVLNQCIQLFDMKKNEIDFHDSRVDIVATYLVVLITSKVKKIVDENKNKIYKEDNSIDLLEKYKKNFVENMKKIIQKKLSA